MILFDPKEMFQSRIEGLKRLITKMERDLHVDGTSALRRVHAIETKIERCCELPNREAHRCGVEIEVLLDRLDEWCTWTSIRTMFARLEENEDLFLTPSGMDWFQGLKSWIRELLSDGDHTAAVAVLHRVEHVLALKSFEGKIEGLESIRPLPEVSGLRGTEQ